MTLLEQETFICLDCETTGLEPKSDRLIEVAVAKFTFQQVLDSYETLINPQIPIPENTTAIHHITDAMVQDKPPVTDILPSVLELIGNHTIIGHGIQFDIQFLIEECKRSNIPCHLNKNRFLDTLRMARLYGQSPVNSLERLRIHFNIAEEGAHRAMNDVIVNIEVFKYLAANFKTEREIHNRLEKPILLKTMPLGKYKGRPFKEIPTEYLTWAAKKDFDKDLLFSLRSELKQRKTGQQFSQAINPFANL
jgi:DNA polymerase III subunit epsilon